MGYVLRLSQKSSSIFCAKHSSTQSAFSRVSCNAYENLVLYGKSRRVQIFCIWMLVITAKSLD